MAAAVEAGAVVVVEAVVAVGVVQEVEVNNITSAATPQPKQ